MIKEALDELAVTDPAERVLLLSHCLRPSQTCPGKFDKQGLHCPEDCREDCAVGRLSRSALSMGYGGVCIAAGGKMALRFVAEHRPKGIVAVACYKELEEGVSSVQNMCMEEGGIPTIVVVPLTRDGCIDTEVDEDQVLEALAVGCYVNLRQ